MSLSPKKCYSSPQASLEKGFGGSLAWAFSLCLLQFAEPKVVSDLELRSFKVKNCDLQNVSMWSREMSW